MSAWDTYQARANVHGHDRREISLRREVSFINRRLPGNLSYNTVEVYPQEYGYNIDDPEMMEHCIVQDVAIIDSDNLDEKTILTMPSEDIDLGSLVYWMDMYWLVTEKDFNSTIRTRAKLTQCNYLLKWVANDDTIIEQWVIFTDSTKYLTGHLEDKYFFTTRGDARSALELAKNKYTVQLNRDQRFLIDDPDNAEKLAYQLTKPVKGPYLYNGKGTYQFVLQEVVSTDDDNQELGIADYYKHFPADPTKLPMPATHPDPEGRRSWL